MSSQALKKQAQPRRLLIPQAPVLVMGGHRLFCLTTDGELKNIKTQEARLLVRQHMPIVCNALHLAARIGIERFHAYDVLELFAFIHPGKFSVPTPHGLARALNLFEPATPEDQCLILRDSIRHLLIDLTTPERTEKSNPAALAAMMGLAGTVHPKKEGWPWTPVILAALDRSKTLPSQSEIRTAMRVWDKMPEWSIHAPEPQPGHHGVDEKEVSDRLHKLLQKQHKEDRLEQNQYAQALAAAFTPQDEVGNPPVVLAEAGTGVGKTIGYLSPATVWAEKNGGSVWISTFTRNLQRQIEGELDRLYDDPVTKSRKVVTRKGRENYLCLLNLEDTTHAPGILTGGNAATTLGLMLRWAAVTKDGDLAGKDFPGWLAGLLGRGWLYRFADRRGECVYSGCPHFNKCFIEKSIRKAKRADIVIANHALVMQQIVTNSADSALPGHFIFDEGHHLFEAADSAFDMQLNGKWTAELRRWLLGSESERRTRARGIRRRLEDLIADDDNAAKDLDDLVEAARCLPAPTWRQRLLEDTPKGATESFLTLCHQQVLARNKEQNGFYSLEADIQPLLPGLLEAAHALRLRLGDLRRPMISLIKKLQNKLANDTDSLNSDARERIHYTINSLSFRADVLVGGWIDMLDSLKITPPAECVDWLEITRIEGHDNDVGFYRYYVDPAQIFAERLKPHAQGIAMTSATLCDISKDDSKGWTCALARTGVRHLSDTPKLFRAASPFDYKNQTRVLIVNDVKKSNVDEVTAAFRELFLASGGGALGIFTAVQRLKAVYKKLLLPIEENGIPLYAQHVDPLDASTLIDIFKEEEDACLLGTDATRDGIDVPGRSLRLVVYDRVPWPRPTILHKARRASFGKNYDDMLTRFKLKQAYGRLIRRSDDKGIFVMLDGALPSRLSTAFPEGVAVERIGIAEAIALTKEFLKLT